MYVFVFPSYLPCLQSVTTKLCRNKNNKNHAPNYHKTTDVIYKFNEIEQIFNKNFPPDEIFPSISALKDTAVSLGKN